jgi:flagellar biosynthetic protein FliQ
MTESDVLYLAKEAIGTGLLVGGPILGVSLLVGLIISVFQAMTQIQEQTLTFIPKIFAIALVLILLGPWLLEIMTNYTINLFTELPNFAKYCPKPLPPPF